MVTNVNQGTPSQLPVNPQDEIVGKARRLWEKYNWNNGNRDFSSILTKHPDCAEFLYESGLVFMIRGYQHTLDRFPREPYSDLEAMREGIRLDAYDEHPLFWVNGEWVHWGDLKERIRWDAKAKRIVSTHNPEEEWNYFAPSGLCPRSHYSDVYSIYQLCTDEMSALQIEAEKFFQGDVPETFEQNKNRWHYLQVFTSHNMFLSKFSHASARLIDAEGAVYSDGLETSDAEIPFKEQSLLATYNGYVTSLDYDEFKPFTSRRVTTIPLTEEQFNNALQKVKTYAVTPLRFNRMHQNCSTYVTNIMKAAGHPLDIRSTLPGLIGDLFPHVPWISRIRNYIGSSIFMAIPRKISSIFTNLVGLYLGTTKSTPLKPGIPETGIDNAEEMQYFEKLITKPSDIFSDEAAIIYSVPRLVNWQSEQGSTTIHTHDGSPQLTIIP